MGTLHDLGYELKAPNPLQRLVQQFAASRPGAWVLARTLYPVDKLLFRITGGRATIPSLLAALPVIMLTSRGAKSGKTRTTPLLGIPMGEDVAVIGTNYGRRATPGWVYNLEADPSASVAYRDRTVAITARLADEGEREAAFARAGGVYPGYAKYRSRADHRVIRVFVLESAA